MFFPFRVYFFIFFLFLVWNGGSFLSYSLPGLLNCGLVVLLVCGLFFLVFWISFLGRKLCSKNVWKRFCQSPSVARFFPCTLAWLYGKTHGEINEHRLKKSVTFPILYRRESLEQFDLRSQMGPAEKKIENSFKPSWLSFAARASCHRLSRGFSAVLPGPVHCPRRRRRSVTFSQIYSSPRAPWSPCRAWCSACVTRSFRTITSSSTVS